VHAMRANKTIVDIKLRPGTVSFWWITDTYSRRLCQSA